MDTITDDAQVSGTTDADALICYQTSVTAGHLLHLAATGMVGAAPVRSDRSNPLEHQPGVTT